MQQIESSEMYCKDMMMRDDDKRWSKNKKMIKHPTSVIFHVHNIQISK